MTKTEQINELATALALAQGEIENAAKDANNPFFKSKYADLASVRGAIQAPFTKHGLSFTQLLGNDAHGITVETVLLHKSGQWLASTFSVKPIKDDPQGAGSAITYARRYSLQAIAGIASEDDDGEGAMGRKTAQEPTPKAQPAKPVEKPVEEAKPTDPAPSSGELVHPAVDSLKTGESCVVSGRKVETVSTPKGKQPRVKFVGDPMQYILGKNEEAKAGEDMTCDVTCKETGSGVMYYELTNCVPF